MSARQDDALGVVAVLHDPVRARLYAFLREQHAPVTREQAAAAVGISRKLAAFHLDKLVNAGLLVANFAAPAGSRGPGRTPKAYVPAAGEWQVTVPARRYDLLAEMLVRAAVAEDPGESARAAALRVARDTGRDLGTQARAERGLGRLGVERAMSVARDLLDTAGYEPRRAVDGAVGNGPVIELRNCPFAQLAAASPGLVCALNERFLHGMLEGLGAAEQLEAVLQPGRSGCCVRIRTARAGREAQAPTA